MYKNEDGLLIKIEINEKKCCGCGLCKEMSKCFQETSQGIAKPINGGYQKKDKIFEVQNVISVCPTNSIKYYVGSTIKRKGVPTVEDLKKKIKKEFINFEYPKPLYKDFDWNYYCPDVDGEGFISWSGYDYSSSDRAEKAGLNEIDKRIFSQLEKIKKIALLEYKCKRLYSLISYENNNANFYYRENEKFADNVMGLLLEIEMLTGKKIGQKVSLAHIYAMPNFGYNGRNIERFTKIEEHTGLIGEELESIGWYSSWIDTHDCDIAESSFWGTRTKTRWAYNAHDAVKKILQHLNMNDTNISKYFEDTIKSENNFLLVVKPMEEEVHKKGETLLEFIDSKKKNLNYIDEKKSKKIKRLSYSYEKSKITMFYEDGTKKIFDVPVHELLDRSEKYAVYLIQEKRRTKEIFVIDLFTSECVFRGDPKGEFGTYDGLKISGEWVVWLGGSINVITGQRVCPKDNIDGFTVVGNQIIYYVGEHTSNRPSSGWAYNFYICDLQWNGKRKIISYPSISNIALELYLYGVCFYRENIYFEFKRSNRYAAPHYIESFNLKTQLEKSKSEIEKRYLELIDENELIEVEKSKVIKHLH